MARVYDCFLGGKDNYAIDREIVERIDVVAPEMRHLVRAGRDWLVRVIRFLAGTARVDQFLDLGAGLPTAVNTHEAAQRVNRDARVIYIDNDPVIAAHGRALLADNDRTHLVLADLTKPDEVFGDPAVLRYLDLDRPLALIHSSTMHHVSDAEDPWNIMRRYADLLPPGSFLALSHFHDPGDGGESSVLARFVEGVFADGNVGVGVFRRRAEIVRMFDGLDLIEPGVTRLNDWWPDGPLTVRHAVADEMALGGVARKPTGAPVGH